MIFSGDCNHACQALFGGLLRWSHRLPSRGRLLRGELRVNLISARLRQGIIVCKRPTAPQSQRDPPPRPQARLFLALLLFLFGPWPAMFPKSDNLESFAVTRPRPSIAAGTVPAVEMRFLFPTRSHVVSFRGFLGVSGNTLS